MIFIIACPFVRICMGMFELRNLFRFFMSAYGTRVCHNAILCFRCGFCFCSLIPCVFCVACNLTCVTAGRRVPMVALIARPFVRICMGMFELRNLLRFFISAYGTRVCHNAILCFCCRCCFRALIPRVFCVACNLACMIAGRRVPMVALIARPFVRICMGMFELRNLLRFFISAYGTRVCHNAILCFRCRCCFRTLIPCVFCIVCNLACMTAGCRVPMMTFIARPLI